MNPVTKNLTPLTRIMSSPNLVREKRILSIVCGLVALALPLPTSRLAVAGEILGARHADHCEGRCRQGDCGKPGCPAHCPVRPDRFGFYGTQWRRWQGEGVVQAAHTEAATPARPPKSEVPTADEESPAAPEPQGSQGEDDGRDVESEALPPGEPAEQMITPPAEKSAEPIEPERKEPKPAGAKAAEREAKEPDAKEPEVEKPRPPAADENLFDEASYQRRRIEALAKLQQQAISAEQPRPEFQPRVVPRRQPLRPSAVEPVSGTAKRSPVRTAAHDEPSSPAGPPQRSNPLR